MSAAATTPATPTTSAPASTLESDTSVEWPLSPDEYLRYGRQMIMPEWGLDGQLKLRSARVAVIGAGGLGCPVLQYLVGAGVGSITIIDHDTVSASNLHRQVLHTTERVGMSKVLSACIALKAINPHVELIPLTEPLLPSTALEQLRNHDLVLDCTDRPTTRYLVSDAAVALRLPLVSGAAVGAAGQWAVYGGRRDEAGSPSGGERRPCYRCLWPRAGASQRCDDAGVWGPVTGFVGSGMAAAALKVLMGGEELGLHVLHLGGSPMVRTVRMRPASDKCLACGPNAGDTPLVETEDYDAFCGTVVVDESTGLVDGQSGERIEVEDLQPILGTPGVVVVDTRPPGEYAICALPNTTNIPLATILATPEVVPDVDRLVFLCRRGNDSQIAAARLRTVRPTSGVQDVRGGLGAWTRRIDGRFPVY